MDLSFDIPGGSRIRFGSAAEWLPRLLPEGARTIVVADRRVAQLHPALVAGREHLLFDGGEERKTLSTVEALCGALIERGADRRTFLLGMGGGIATDLTGLLAALYMRGVRCGFVSTSLLGQADASVGGKNGVNVGGYKNIAGVFRQPEFVVCDTSLLPTLPDREFRAGLAEIVKAGLLGDADLFALLETESFDSLRGGAVERALAAAVRLKAAVVERDEREAGERRKLNLGHTFGHAVEKLCPGRLNHGEAVAVGMRIAADIAVRCGALAPADRTRIVGVLERFGFALESPLPPRELLAAVAHDKKAESEGVWFVLPTAIGRCEVRRMTLEELASCL